MNDYTKKLVAPKEYKITTTKTGWTLPEIEKSHSDFLVDSSLREGFCQRRGLSVNTTKQFRVGRWDSRVAILPAFDREGKNVIQMRYYNPYNGKRWLMKGKPASVPYQWNMLPHYTSKPESPIWITEGEFDCMMAVQNGLFATTNMSGCLSAHLTWEHFAGELGSNKVILAFDNDEAGFRATALVGLVLQNRVAGHVQWPTWCQDKFDLSDWFRMGKTAEELVHEHVRDLDLEHAQIKAGLKKAPPKVFTVKKPDDEFDLATMWPSKGVLRYYVDHATTVTDAPDQFHCGISLAVVGTALRRKIWYRHGSDNIFTNFYCCIVAPSSRFRKTTSLKIGIRLLTKHDPNLVMPREFSTESFVNHVSQQSTGVFCYSEIAELMDQFKRGYSEGLMSLLTDFYDCPESYERFTMKDGKKTLDKPFLSILGATTIEWLNKNLTVEQAEGGFWPRFLFWSARNPKPLMDIPPPSVDYIYSELSNVLHNLHAKACGPMVLSPGAKKILSEWTHLHVGGGKKSPLGDGYVKYAARMQMYLIKIAMVFEITTSGMGTITEENMRLAANLCNWLLSNLEYLYTYEFAFSKDDAINNLVLAHIREAGVSTPKEVSRRFRLTRRKIDEIIDTLSLRDYIIVDDDDPKGKKFYPQEYTEEQVEA